MRITSLEMTVDKETRDGRFREIRQEWEGTVEDEIAGMSFKFKFKNFYEKENGGRGVEILTPRPKYQRKKTWWKVVELVAEFIDNCFIENENYWCSMEVG